MVVATTTYSSRLAMILAGGRPTSVIQDLTFVGDVSSEAQMVAPVPKDRILGL